MHAERASARAVAGRLRATGGATGDPLLHVSGTLGVGLSSNVCQIHGRGGLRCRPLIGRARGPRLDYGCLGLGVAGDRFEQEGAWGP